MNESKVIVVDDEAIVRAGLENWLSRDYQVVCFDGASAFLDAFNEFEFEDGIPTCILLDFQMPGLNGVELQQALKAMNAEFPIIFMSGNAQQSDIIDAWRGGAVDFILKPFTPAQISEAIETQFKRGQQQRPNRLISDNKPSIQIPITKREAEVLLLLGNGSKQTEVATILGISVRTVKMYRTFLKNKLDLNTLAELVRFCSEHEESIKKIAKNGKKNSD